jgi:hypothetical protein
LPIWNEADLEARLCRALDLARTTLVYFAEAGYTDEESADYSFGPDKPLAETAMLIYAASAFRDRARVARRVDELARMLAPHARAERVLAEITLHPTFAFKFAAPHILLTKLGHPDRSFDAFLNSCLSSHASNGYERTPISLIERKWLSSLWTGDCADAARRADLIDSVLNRSFDILGGRREDAYALTHSMMYCTDFGFRAPRFPRRRATILREAASLLARYLDAEDYDLTGEILLSWPLTGAPWSPSAAFVFRVLARVEDEVGVLPCGHSNPVRLSQLQGEARTRYALGTAYHTAYVMGFLCAASLRSGRTPPARIVGPQCEASCLARLFRFVDDDQGHWRSEFTTLPQAEQRALAPLILDVALVQKCRKHDYHAMSELISLACEYHIANSPMCGQAAELLERIMACLHAISLRRRVTTPQNARLTPAVATQVLDSTSDRGAEAQQQAHRDLHGRFPLPDHGRSVYQHAARDGSSNRFRKVGNRDDDQRRVLAGDAASAVQERR